MNWGPFLFIIIIGAIWAKLSWLAIGSERTRANLLPARNKPATRDNSPHPETVAPVTQTGY